MTVQEKFLAAYREYECLLRAAGKEPKQAEESASSLDSGRLRMCRQARNYLCHADDTGFVAISDKMMKFITKKADEIKEEGDTAKKHLKKQDACMLLENTKCADAFEMFRKLKCAELLMLCNDGTYALVSVYELLGCRSTQKAGTLKRQKIKPSFCHPLDSYQNLDSGSIILCTDNGKADGKLLGQVWFKK